MPGGEDTIHVLWRTLPGTPIVTRREPDGTETVLIRFKGHTLAPDKA